MKTSIYFQKRAIVLVGAMLLTITNLNVYSSVGSYQTNSQAIDANANYKKGIYLTRKYTNVPASVWADLVQHVTDLPIDDSTHVYLIIGLDGKLCLNIDASSNSFLSFKNKDYAKYDFSGFDN